jgi:hypothetical protein
MPIKLRRTNPDTGQVQWRNLASLKLKRTNPSTGILEWRNVPRAFLKVAGSWKVIFGLAGPTIDFPLEITRSSASWPSTLTGKNYHWNDADTLTYKFQSSLTDTTDDGAWTDLMSYTTITNPAVGSSNTKTFSITSANFSTTVKSKWFRFVVKAVDTANDITTIEYSNTVNISKTDLVGTPGTVVIERQSASSYVYSVTNNGTWSSTPESYEYQWQQNVNGTWTDITTGATGQTTSSITFTSPQSYLDQQIRCQVTAVDDLGALSALPINSNILTVNAAPPLINSFTVIGDAMQAFYSFDVSSVYNIGSGLTIEIVFQQKLNNGTWLTTNTIFPSSKTGTNVTVLFNDGGTYRGTIYVRDNINPEISFTTPEFSVERMFFRNVAINETQTGFTAPSNINFANTWLPGQSVQTGAIGWTNGANMNTTDVYWSGNYNGSEINKPVSGQGQYVEFDLSESTGNASITATVEQTGLGQATISWEQQGSQSYKIIYRVDSNVSPGYTDIPVTGNDSSTFPSKIVNATDSDVSVRALYLYSLPNQTGREFGSTITFPPTVTLGAGTQLEATASGTINLITAPTAPTGLTLTSQNDNVLTFSWSPPTNDGGTPITGYDVMVFTNTGSFVDVGNVLSHTGTFLPGNTGIFYVRAKNAWGLGPSAFTQTYNIPSINSGPTASSITSSSATLGWSSNRQSTYSLSIAGSPSGVYTGTTAQFRDISDLSPSTTYPYALTITSDTGQTVTQNLYNTITGASTNGSVVTYTTSNQLRAGQTVRVTGISPSAYNITGTVASATRTSFSINTFVNPGTTYSSGGVASAIFTTLTPTPTPTGTISVSNITSTQCTATFTVSNAGSWQVYGSYIGGAFFLSSVNPSSPVTVTNLPSGANGVTIGLNMWTGANQTGTLYQVSTSINVPAGSSAPSTPTGLINTYSSGPSWTGSWNASTGTAPITYYWELYQSASIGGSLTAFASGSTSGTSFTQSMSSANGLWAYFVVVASNSVGSSGTATSEWA